MTQITAYFAFSAAMVLYIYVIQKGASPPETYGAYFSAAARCQSHMSAVAQRGSLLERYCVVLEELRSEALRQMRGWRASVGFVGVGVDVYAQDGAQQQQLMVPADVSPEEGTGYAGVMGGDALAFNGFSAPVLGDFSGWGQFASMVSSGLGNLDGFMDDDTFRLS